ncbi:MAG TPA: aspartate carbamoyltransferase catalytic subunit [Clostridiaceae bacterium]|jgi:aspartate carbamoyltransferase catalytic subunit|nr:aspartate carbamoyltransferase catalytic subunit [Clostridiaceae bacterium]
MSALKSKHILGLFDMPVDDIQLILKTAGSMKYMLTSGNKRGPHLQGKSIVTLFYENSTRTRLSFELASKYLGASAANISASGSSVSKGETLLDTARTINMMGADVIVIRHPMSGAPRFLSKHIKASVINAGDGMNEHPTQALLDMYTIMEKKGAISGLNVCILGDIYHSRVARSNIWGLTKMGAKVSVAGPATLLPPQIEKMGVKVFGTVQQAIIDADVIINLRIQAERLSHCLLPSLREYSRFYGVDRKILSLAKKDAIILHPGPVNRGVELTSDIIDGDSSFINEQVTNGVAVRMALLFLLTRRSTDEAAC